MCRNKILCISHGITSSAQQNGDLRLVDDRPPVVNFDDGPRGRIEIFLNGQWGTVCAQQTTFLHSFGSIACQQLGHGGSVVLVLGLCF